MNRVHALFLRQRHDAFVIEIGPERPFVLVQLISLVRLEAMDREPVFIGVDRHGAQAQLRRRAEDTDGDFTAVGHQQLAERAEAARQREELNGLYVAMTRAEDRLYVGGWVGSRKPDGGCWYERIEAGLRGQGGQRAGDDDHKTL